METIIDATDLIVGRMATNVAKRALLGEKIIIVNCEKAVMSGRKKEIQERYQNKNSMGTPKGPFLLKSPDKIVRRIIRGMIPYRKERGEKAFKNIKCYKGAPKEFEGKKLETIKQASVEKLPNMKYITIGQISKIFGVK